MPFGRSIAKAYAKADDVERKLLLRAQSLHLLEGNRGETKLATLSKGWNLDDREYFEPPPSGERYYKLYVNDPDGSYLEVLQRMSAVRIDSKMYSISTKPSFLSAVPSYLFRIKAMGVQI